MDDSSRKVSAMDFIVTFTSVARSGHSNISRCICPHLIAKSANKTSSNVAVFCVKTSRSAHGFRVIIAYLMCMDGDSYSLGFSGETKIIEHRTRDVHSHRSGCASTMEADYFCYVYPRFKYTTESSS